MFKEVRFGRACFGLDKLIEFRHRAKKNKRATSNLLQDENERLRLVVDIIALRNQVSKQLATIDRLQSGSSMQQETMTCLAAAGGGPADPQAFRQARLDLGGMH